MNKITRSKKMNSEKRIKLNKKMIEKNGDYIVLS